MTWSNKKMDTNMTRNKDKMGTVDVQRGGDVER